MYVICGASGNTGNAAARELLANGQKVRVVGRSKERLKALAELGANVFVTNLTDVGGLREAFTGCSGVYALIPPNVEVDNFRAYQNQVSDAVTQAIQAAKVGRVVLLSSVGADQQAGTGPIIGLGEFERKLRKVPGLNALAVRAGMFMQNFLMSIGMIRAQGVNAAPFPPDAPVPFTDAGDIGRYAAKRLQAGDFKGSEAVYFVGPRGVTMREATQTLGQAIGRPDLSYVQVSFDAAEQGLLANGLKPQLAGLYVEMYRAFAENRVTLEPGVPVVQAITQLDTFARQFANTYERSGR